jgi:hypothetical protein
MAAMAPALREELTPPVAAPLPPTRINGAPSTVQTSTGPTLAGSRARMGEAPTARTFPCQGHGFCAHAARRPDGEDSTGAETVALAYAPLPPARPARSRRRTRFRHSGVRALRSLQPQRRRSAPLPPRRPDLPVMVASAAPVDLPATTGSTPKTGRRPSRSRSRSRGKAVPETRSSGRQEAPATALSALMSAEPSLHMGSRASPWATWRRTASPDRRSAAERGEIIKRAPSGALSRQSSCLRL